MLALGGRFTSGELLARAMRAEEPRAARINRVFDDHDVLLTPTLPKPPDRLGRVEGRSLPAAIQAASELVAFTTAWNITGQPAMSVPAPSTDDGVPLGVTLVGRPNDESTLISLAAHLEAEVGWPARRPPVDSR
jgi:amidase